MNKKIILMLSVILLVLFLALVIINSRHVDSDIQNFVDSSNFPQVQKVNILLSNPKENLKFFQVSFGKPQDCPSGCFYSSALGLKYNGKIGWISIEDYDSLPDKTNIVRYSLDSYNNYILSKEFYNELKSYSEKENKDMVLERGVTEFILKNPNTSEGTLMYIYDNYKFMDNNIVYYDVGATVALLENPNIGQYKQILTIISNLPSNSGSNDKYIEQAKSLLNSN